MSERRGTVMVAPLLKQSLKFGRAKYVGRSLVSRREFGSKPARLRLFPDLVSPIL